MNKFEERGMSKFRMGEKVNIITDTDNGMFYLQKKGWYVAKITFTEGIGYQYSLINELDSISWLQESELRCFT
jgi:hypothetical protein